MLLVLWNGGKLQPLQPSLGLRQGDLLSLYLFVLCMERLALRIQELNREGSWKAIQISQGGPPLSHFLFAYDIFLFCHAME
uniref:Reverse transcriptase domain-containing protein n=1 Tax=Cajanus cajan TaxID=3821 RepID=A0A151R429_CAJCA|nr:hypothetical protein KK1_041541 [Cajanus cajan]